MRVMNHNSNRNQRQWRNKRHMRGVSDVIMGFDGVVN
jgi:hypothetical protein